jgi:hypothetical protein
MYRGLAPHKFTPMPGVHNGIKTDGLDTAVFVSYQCNRRSGLLPFLQPNLPVAYTRRST